MSNGKNELVAKSNRLVEASYRLTLVEQRIILLAIVKARKTERGLDAETFVEITAIEYGEIFDLAPNQAYEQIKEAVLTLYERGFVLYGTHHRSGKPEVIKARWVSAATYVDGAGAIRLQFSPQVIPYITRLEAEFTRYKLGQVVNMTSVHAVRMYEMLVQWGSAGHREIELTWFRDALMLDQQYKAIKDLKKYVIDVGVDQVNKHSDLTCSYTQRKTGRQVTHLTFEFRPKVKPEAKPKRASKAKPAVDDGSEKAKREVARTKAMLEANMASPRRTPEIAKAALALMVRQILPIIN